MSRTQFTQERNRVKHPTRVVADKLIRVKVRQSTSRFVPPISIVYITLTLASGPQAVTPMRTITKISGEWGMRTYRPQAHPRQTDSVSHHRICQPGVVRDRNHEVRVNIAHTGKEVAEKVMRPRQEMSRATPTSGRRVGIAVSRQCNENAHQRAFLVHRLMAVYKYGQVNLDNLSTRACKIVFKQDVYLIQRR